ncbi:TOBE domain-containing protein [Leisingera sp. D0M16]|uniref:TOBE domain-containing protein n=1 Tax=Leisingera coralii TaxID=3351347 RepID=UPI003B7CD26B
MQSHEAGLYQGQRPEMLQLSGPDAPITGTIAKSGNLGAELFLQVEVPGLENRIILRASPSQAQVLQLAGSSA